MRSPHVRSGIRSTCLLQAALAGAVLSLASLQRVTAGPFEDGVAALVRLDYASAISSLQAAADHGDPKGEYLLGVLYRAGRGVPANPGRALALFEGHAGALPAM